MDMATLADRPDLPGATFGIPYADDSAAFMQGDLAALLVNSDRLARRWPEYVIAVLGGDGVPVARGVSVPFAARTDGRDSYPAAGWDQIAVWAAEDAMDGITPDTVCALEIAVHPEYQLRGLSAIALRGLLDNSRRLGFARLVAPVRPPAKANEPMVAMTAYMNRTRSDGLPEDPWLRVHVRHGGQIITVAPLLGYRPGPVAAVAGLGKPGIRRGRRGDSARGLGPGAGLGRPGHCRLCRAQRLGPARPQVTTPGRQATGVTVRQRYPHRGHCRPGYPQ